MSSRNVLVVLFESAPAEKVQEAVQARQEFADVTVHVVAPATTTGALQWLTGDEDAAREEAEGLAARAAEAVEGEVETEVGDRDPLLAVQDALGTFRADEIVVAGEASAETEEALRRLGLPVSRLDGEPERDGKETGAGAVARGVARGRSSQTPLVALGIVGGVVLSTVVLVSLIVLLVYWLA
jgi:hypothetical protein